MKSASCHELYNENPKTTTKNDIIYLYTPKKTARRRGRSGDVFWNIIFAVMCLSVLAILLLH